MFRAWKDTILSHYSLISGKGLKNKKHRFSNDLSHPHSKLFPCPLQPRRRPTAEKFWAIEQGRLRPFVLRSCFAHKQPRKSAHPARILGVRIIGSARPVCQTNR